ncbi:MAG: hypothetical protein E6K13_09350 [Methanobacteriota archaeon]|nr:MAG: hypothetical protein E6K13_09350 [Euryarchaeota archaeon]
MSFAAHPEPPSRRLGGVSGRPSFPPAPKFRVAAPHEDRPLPACGCDERVTETAAPPPKGHKRVTSGIPGLDSLIQGGFPAGTSVILQGPAGVEKDAFLAQFVADTLNRGGSALVVLTSLPRARFQETLRSGGVNVDQAIEEHRLRFVEWLVRSDETGPKVEVDGPTFRSSGGLPNAAVAISQAIDALAKDGEKRAALDILSPALLVADPATVVGFARAMRTILSRFEFTSLFVLEKTHDPSIVSTLHRAFDGVVDLERVREGNEIVRKISLLSLKGTALDTEPARLVMGPNGLIRSVGDGEASGGRIRQDSDSEDRGPGSPQPVGTGTESRAVPPSPDRSNGEDSVARHLAIANERLRTDPENADALFVKAASYARRGRRQDLLTAISALEALAKIDEMYPGLWRLKAKLHGGLGEREEAEECHFRAVEVEHFRELALKPAGHAPVTRAPPDPPKPQSSDDARRRGRTSGPTRPPTRAPGHTNGLVNGLQKLRAGVTNGLTNGLTGRINGLTSALAYGRAGATKGVASSIRTRTDGLTNGDRGRRSANGWTNGLTNGNGFTNGLGAGRFRREVAATRWKLYVIPLLSLALLIVPLLGANTNSATDRYPIRIDGNVGDWNPAAIAAEVRSVGPNPDVDIVRFGIADNVDYLAFFLEVNGAALRGGDLPPTVDVFRVFLDTDRDAATGYRVDGLGADRMLQVSGWHGAVNTSTLFEWDTNRDAFDWRGWTKGTPAQAAVSGSRVEAQVDWLAILPSKQPVYATAHARSHDGTDDTADYVLSSDGASLIVVQDAVVSDLVSGTAQLLRLDLSAFGSDAAATGITVTLTGSSSYMSVPRLRLVDAVGLVMDERIPLDRRVPFAFPSRTIRVGAVDRWYVIADTPPGTGETLGAFIAGSGDVVAPLAAVTIRTSASPRDVGYLGSIPSGPRIDGGFDEWTSPISDLPLDVAGVPRTNLDLDAFDSKSSGNRSFFFAQVTGSMMTGTWVPKTNGPTPSSSVAPPDQDRDGVPDSVDPLPFDFNNDGVPDSQSGGDYDGDRVIDYGQAGGTDEVLNTTIPASFPAPYAGKAVSVFIGPVQEPYRSPDDMLRVFVDIDNVTWSGYTIGGLGADRMVEVSGTAGRVRSAGLYAFAGNYPGEWSWLPLANVSFALGSKRVEVSTPVNLSSSGSRYYVEIGNSLGSSDSTAQGGVATRGTSGTTATSFSVAPMPVPMYLPRSSTSSQTRANVLIDANSNAVTTQYNHQRKVVRAGDVSGDTACDATNSDGCWYSVFSDQSGPEDAATTAAGTETVTRGTKVSGTFPTDIATPDGVYINYRELKYQIGALGYKSSTGNGVNFPKQLDWTTSAWDTPETELDSAGAAVENVRVVWDTTGDSTLFWIVLNTGTNIHAYKCTNADSCVKEDVDPSSGNDYAVTQAVGTAPERHWDVSIEATSGELLLAYDNPAAVANDFCYRTRTAGGSGTWSSETCFDHSSVASTNPSFSYVVLANNPGSNRIGFGAFDTTNDDFVVAVWDGSAWVNANKAVSTGVTLTGGWGGTVVAEDSADEFVAYAGNGANSMAECEWTSAGGWEATCATFDPNSVAGNDLRIMFAVPLLGTNKAMVCQGDDLDDDTCWRWNGASGTGGTRGAVQVQTTGDGSAGAIDMRTGFAWNPDQSGTADGLVIYYAGISGILNYNTYNDATDVWGTASTFTSAGSHKWVRLVAPSDSGSTDKVHAVVSNSNSDILAYRWSGSGAPGSEQVITADTVNENYPYWDLAFQGQANYHLDVRHNWTGIPSSDAYTLKVKGYRGDENINVQVLTPPSTWTTRLTVTATSNTLITYVLTNAEYNGGTPAIRLVDPAAVDTTQSDVFIDLSVVVTEGHSDRVTIMRSLDTSGSTWGSQVVLASGNTAPFSTATGSFNIGTGAVGTTVTVTTGFQPKVYFLWESGAVETTDTATGSNMKRGFGVGISTTDRRAVCSFSNNANSGADTSSGHRADAVLCSLTSAQALDALVDHDAMLSNGFRVIIDDTSSKDLRVHYLAIGGTDLTNVVSGMFTESGATGNQDVTDVGFQPDAVVLFSADIGADPPGIQADSSMMIGLAAGAGNPNDVVWAGGSNNAANPTQTVAYSRAGESIALLNAGVTATDGRAEVDAWLSNGFSLNWNERAASRRIFYVAMKGGQHAVGDVLTRTDTTQFSETGLPFTPKAGLFLSHTHAQSTADTVQDYDEWSVGSVTNATTRRAMCANDQDNVATTVVRYGVHHNELYCNLATSAAFEGLMDVVSVNSDGWTFVMDDADPTASFVGYWAIGATTPTPFYGYDSAEPSIAMDSSGYLHVAWVSAYAHDLHGLERESAHRMEPIKERGIRSVGRLSVEHRDEHR